jgi:hypothetical protein
VTKPSGFVTIERAVRTTGVPRYSILVAAAKGSIATLLANDQVLVLGADVAKMARERQRSPRAAEPAA